MAAFDTAFYPVLNQPRFSFHQFLAFIRRNLVLIVLSGSLVTFWMLIYTFAVYKPSYAAKALVIIKDSALTRRFVEPEQSYTLQTTTSSSSNPVLNTMSILKAGAISDAVYEYFKEKHPEQLQKSKIMNRDDWERFFGDGSAFIKAKNQSGTDVISIEFSWSNPQIAKETLETVVTAFQKASRDLNQQEQISRTHFMDRQMQDIEAQLAAVRRQKSSFQSNMGVVSVGRTGEDLSSSRVALISQLNQVEARAQGKTEQLKRYEAVLGLTPEQGVKAVAMGQSLTMNKLQDEVYRLQQLYAQQMTTLGEQAPLTQETRAQLIQARANVRMEQNRTLGRSRSGSSSGLTGSPVVMDQARNLMIAEMIRVQGEKEDLQTQSVVLQDRLTKLDHQIQEFPQAAEGLASIEQREASLSLALDQLRQKVLEGHLKEAQTLSNVFIVDAASLPEQSKFPGQKHLLVLSLVLGVMTGLASAVVKEQLFPNDAEADAPNWLLPLDKMDDELDTADNFESESIFHKPANGSRFDSLVPVSHPEMEPVRSASKQNPYMHVPASMSGRTAQSTFEADEAQPSSSQLHAALREALRAQRNKQPV